MLKLNNWSFVIGLLGLFIGSFSLWQTFANKIFLERRIETLEIKNIEGLFQLESPKEHTVLPAKKESTLTGKYIRAIPESYKLVAVLQNRNAYYVSRSKLILEPDRKWSLMIRPWPADEWKVIICLATEDANNEMEKWASEKTPSGETNWDNPRSKLPDGVIKNTIFVFSAK